MKHKTMGKFLALLAILIVVFSVTACTAVQPTTEKGAG